jgi:hypothetical protein
MGGEKSEGGRRIDEESHGRVELTEKGDGGGTLIKSQRGGRTPVAGGGHMVGGKVKALHEP